MGLAEADKRTMLRCTLLPWLRDKDEVISERHDPAVNSARKGSGRLNTVKHLASVNNLIPFARPDEGPTTVTAEAYVRKRGRPSKHRKSASGNETEYTLTCSQTKSRSPGKSRNSMSPCKRASSRVRSQSRAKSQARHGQSGWKYVGSLRIWAVGWEAAGVTWCLVIMAGLAVDMLGVFGAEATEFV
jgi:hypothetical protein